VTLLRPPPRPWIQRALLATFAAVVLLIAMDWAYVPTFRLFLDQRVASVPSASGQQFGIENDRVVPTIVTRGPDRVAFATEIGQDSTIHVGLRPEGRVAYAIEWRRGSTRQVLAQGTTDAPAEVVCDYPTGTGVVELVSDGAVTWVDPRVVRNLPMAPYGWAAVFLALCAVTWRCRHSAEPAWFGFTPLTLLKTAAAVASLGLSLLAAEVFLRALGENVPNGIAAERHDLGEANADPHWVDSPRYARRLRAGVETLNEWRDGDIVRMGFIPPASPPGPLHRFSFRTDAEGFRNETVRDHFEVAALGDSFTDAMTMAGEASWPARLEGLLGVAVQNYGTAGFGPQQELLVLKDYVASHRPRTVVLAFFAGNDIFDAEAFDAFQRSGGTIKRPGQGWRIKDVTSRVDEWFVVSALSAGRRLRWAFMPPYLNTLNFSREDLEARSGWGLTSGAIAEMRAVSRSFGAEFVVMFVPFKSQVYLPLLQAAWSKTELESAFRFYLERYGRPIDVDGMLANRLAQNEMMAKLCADAGIPFLDLTPALAARVAAGENVYFPDESHLNQVGETVVAESLAKFIETRRLAPHGVPH